MILKDLLPKTNFEEIWSIILKYWPDQDVNKSGYEKVYAQLKDIEPSLETEGDEYLLQVKIESFDEGDCLIAHGVEYVEGQEYPNYYGLAYIPWSEWLGCAMEKETVDNLSPNEIYAGCLFEMTWCGFTEKKRTEAREKLERLCSKNDCPENEEDCEDDNV